MSQASKTVTPIRWGDIPEWAVSISQALLKALRERDPYTYGHCRRVSTYARLLAGAVGLNEYEQKVVEYSALFHDLGKIGIPDAILLKPGRLTPEEEKIMRLHPVKSAEIIEPLHTLPFFEATLPGILHHHERMDGAGYPNGVSGEQIPLSARVLLIADTFDAMTTTRPYRKGLDREVAYKELRNFSGRQFDPRLVEIFLKAHPTWGSVEEEISELFISSNFKRVA